MITKIAISDIVTICECVTSTDFDRCIGRFVRQMMGFYGQAYTKETVACIQGAVRCFRADAQAYGCNYLAETVLANFTVDGVPVDKVEYKPYPRYR